ncbi:Pepsin A-2/A-3 [Clonorchis sinensis]|uniref:Pepsin A-2/A-3 n=1 Tax=Clonorchis sinensis TaxID=79923 RepID=A0A419QF59_CLOSI|nr:Pepsin A-2/A-3 [Clonorchis sinensis]
MRIPSEIAQWLEYDNRKVLSSNLTCASRLPLSRFGQPGSIPNFYVVVGFGTPRQNFRLLIDTGSSTLWVPSDKCEPGLFAHNNKFKDISETFQEKAGALCETYGDGSSIEGTLGTDILNVSGTMVVGVTFGQVHYANGLFSLSASDGQLGLAFGETAESFDQTLLEYLFAQELISQLVFTIVYPSPTLSPGKITFGGINPEDYRGEISYTAVFPGEFWRVQFHRMEVNGNTVAHDFIGIADTGTYLVTCPYVSLLNLVSQLGVYLEPEQQVDCKEADEFPEIIFTLDGFRLGFPRDLYVDRIPLFPSLRRFNQRECIHNFSPVTL